MVPPSVQKQSTIEWDYFAIHIKSHKNKIQKKEQNILHLNKYIFRSKIDNKLQI